MTPRKSYARIAITLPPEDLVAADRLAEELDRSRSWVIAEAVRQFVAAQAASAHVLDASRQA
jgi:predicted transcriptional regulator